MERPPPRHWEPIVKTGRKLIIGAALSLTFAGAAAPVVAVATATPAVATVASAPKSWYHM